jgi:kynureninase
MTTESAGVDWAAYRAEFPTLSRTTFLNTCSLGALSQRSRAAVGAFLDLWEEYGASAWYRTWLGEAAALRASFERLVGAPSGSVALAPSVGVALGVVASCYDYAQRNRVITTALDFPTIPHQWLVRPDVEVVLLPSDDGIGVPLERYAAAIDERTALVATAHVYFTTGVRADLRALADACHARGALLLVDAYQATGIVPTDVAADGVDAYVSGTLKWLFGGPGMAFAWVRPALRNALRPTTTGWFSSARQFAFDVEHLEYAADGRQYELGTPSVPSAAIARGGMDLVREIGIDRLGERTRDLGDLCIHLAEAAGLAVATLHDAEWRGGVIPIRVADPRPVVEALAAERIIVDYRPGIVRCSPAFYTAEDEVRLLVDRLDDLVPASDRLS